MMLFGHILFGTMALIGAFLLEIGFRKDFQELNLVQRLGIIFTIVGMFATVAMGIYPLQYKNITEFFCFFVADIEVYMLILIHIGKF